MKRRRNIAENFNRLSRVHERYRQTDDRQTDGGTTYSDHEQEFSFAKKLTQYQKVLAGLIFLLRLQYMYTQQNVPVSTSVPLIFLEQSVQNASAAPRSL